jgi:hypothetical protein
VVCISESTSRWRHDFYGRIYVMLLQYSYKRDLRNKDIENKQYLLVLSYVFDTPIRIIKSIQL